MYEASAVNDIEASNDGCNIPPAIAAQVNQSGKNLRYWGHLNLKVIDFL